ncbi:MAG: DUF1704 domain-containing protein [Deltaproteobacteria bacterium]|nr:DUF1704 domain-containing protein [Deltaproteobacteria bacterium]
MLRQLDRVRSLAESQREARVRVLEAIAWPPEVEAAFFAHKAQRLPEVTYTIDREGHEARIQELQAAEDQVDGDDPIAGWLRATVRSVMDAHRLTLAAGTQEFYRLSRALYGGAHSRFHGNEERNIDLAEHLLARLRVHGWDEARDPEEPRLTAEETAAEFRRRLTRDYPSMAVEVVVDERCTAKVLAGQSRVRVRRGAEFHPWELDGLWHHEVETHVLSAQNGALQRHVPFLRAGGPRTTRTQEGLAVFAELHNHSLTTSRMERLARRVKLVAMAEEGADFLELYRYLTGLGVEAREAFLDAQRICRGGRVQGGAPFTKDACYLAGLLDVHAFLAAVVRGGFRDETELLVCGRIDLEDVHALVLLRQHGVLKRPRYLPPWLRRWRTLLPEFAFTSFLADVNLQAVEAHYRGLIDAASRASPPESSHGIS